MRLELILRNAFSSPGRSTLIGDDGSNDLDGAGGDDAINGLGGDDHLFGGEGEDTIDGGTGNDPRSPATSPYQLQQAQAALAQAEREELQASEAVERAERDYSRGALSAESFEGLRPTLAKKREAARAEVERLQTHERDIAKATALDDAEQAVLEWLTELREVIAGKIRDAESVEALRNALMRVFEHFELNSDPGANMQIVPVLREDALVTDDPEAPPAMYMTGVRVPQANDSSPRSPRPARCPACR